MKAVHTKLVLVGDGAARAALEARAGTGVEFVGKMSKDDALRRMGAAKGVVSPSRCWETFGLASVEAQSVGTPSLVSDLGGLPDTVAEAETGFVFRSGDAEALAAAIRKVVSLDDSAFDEMAAAARARVAANYSEAPNYAQLQKIYGNARRVLLVHNFYGSSAPSGENQVFESERAMLERHGVCVETYTRQSDEIRHPPTAGFLRRVCGLLKGACSTVGNPFAAHALARKIKAFRPDVVHFHNTFPLIGPLAIRAAHRSGCRVVMTLHNYRLVCAAGIPMRGGKVCAACFGGAAVAGPSCGRPGTSAPTVLPALRNRCYRGSLAATIPLALNIWLYRRRWAKWVDRFIALSEFQKGRMVACGFPQEKVVVKPNFTNVEDCPIVPASERRDEVLYVGRLSEEKGVFTLLEAWNKVANNVGGGAIMCSLPGSARARSCAK